MKTPLLILTLMGAAYLLLRPSAAQAAPVEVVDAGYEFAGFDVSFGAPWIETPEAAEASTSYSWGEILNPFGAIATGVNQYQTGAAMEQTNVQAFLALIRYAEGTERNGLDPYRVCYGYSHTIQDLSDHPAVTGEWRGQRLPDAMCRGAGFGPGCVSTAAGAYQFISSTWAGCKKALRLPDFGQESQDLAAIYLIRQRGALDDVEQGRITEALNKCRREWASLPGAGYGQPERKAAELIAVYERAGGFLA